LSFFSPALTVEALWANIGQNCGFLNGVGHSERKFQGEGGSSTNDSWCQKTRVPGLSRVRDPTFSRFDTIPTCDKQTDRRTHDDGYYPRIASAARVKTQRSVFVSEEYDYIGLSQLLIISIPSFLLIIKTKTGFSFS